MDEYNSSNLKLSFIGRSGQQLLQKARVLLIGAGGLGCPCLQYLAGCGIGSLGIVDFDKVSVSNLHRQILYSFTDVAKSKAVCATERLKASNPFIDIKPIELFVDEKNILPLISDYDIVVDCTDNFQVRYLINDACVFLNKPLVYGAIHQTEGQVTVLNYNGSPTLRCLFPDENNDDIQSCADIGAYNIVTGVIGLMMANEVIKIILNLSETLAGKLFYFNVIDQSTKKIQFHESEEGRKKSFLRFNTEQINHQITPSDLIEMVKNNTSFRLIDVRQSDERNQYNIGGEHILLKSFMQMVIFPYETSEKIIVYCQKGQRSLQAVDHLLKNGYVNSFSLQGGIEYYRLFLNESNNG